MTTLVQHGSWPGWANADIYLRDDAAAAYLTAQAAYRAETGRADGEIAEPVGGIRTVDQVKQMQVAFDSRNPTQMAYWNLDPSSKARPGLDSPHISGLCADIYAADFQWWIDNAARFGFRRTLVGSGDLHHFQFFPGTATAALNVTSIDGTSSPTLQPKDPGMQITSIRDTADTNRIVGYALATENGTAAFGATINVGGAEFKGGDMLNLFRRLIAARLANTDEGFVSSEHAAINVFLSQIGPQPTASQTVTSPSPVLSDADKQAIAQSVVEAFGSDLQQILQAILALPAETLAAFGLQRTAS